MEQMQIPKNQMMNQNINNGGMNMNMMNQQNMMNGYNQMQGYGMNMGQVQMPNMMGNQMMNGYNGMNMMGQQYTNPMMGKAPMPVAPTQINPINPMMNQQNMMNGYNPMMSQQNMYNQTVNPMMGQQYGNQMMNSSMMPMPNQFNARTPMANTTPMASQQMMYQNPMARTNPMMSAATVMNPQMGMVTPQLGMTQPNMNMMNGYANGYNQYNNFGMPPVATQSTMSVMNPTAASMVNQPAHNREINDPTPVSKQELMEKLEKDLPRKKECKDFTFIMTRTNETYIFFKRRNKEWIKKFSGTLWNGCDIKIICEGDVVYIPLAVNSYEEFILDNELLIFLEKLRPNFFLKKLVKSDFIKINGQIICINSDNLLEKYEKYDHSYFFISPERNQLVQDFYNALTNDDYLFIDEKTKRRNTFDSLPRLKELENYFEEVKDYEK